MNKPQSDYNDLLPSETLSLKQIINMAWDADPGGYPYPDEKICEALNRDLHYAIVKGELEGIANLESKRHDRTRLQPLWAWLTKPERKDRAQCEPLRDFCRRWAKVRDETLPDCVRPSSYEYESEVLGPSDIPREKGKRKTKEKYQRWYEDSQEIKTEGKYTRPTDIAKVIAKKEKARMVEVGREAKGVTTANILRRLNEHHPGWAE